LVSDQVAGRVEALVEVALRAEGPGHCGDADGRVARADHAAAAVLEVGFLAVEPTSTGWGGAAMAKKLTRPAA